MPPDPYGGPQSPVSPVAQQHRVQQDWNQLPGHYPSNAPQPSAPPLETRSSYNSARAEREGGPPIAYYEPEETDVEEESVPRYQPAVIPNQAQQGNGQRYAPSPATDYYHRSKFDD
ncbi:hypothetical protein MRB53_039601 [Persea americana]|nr:hypothetical protein MRB53_039601 [Persea americana]